MPTLLLIASRPSFAPLFPPNADSAVKSRCISELLDFQRDWLVEQCPAELRDEYLVDAFASPGARTWAQLKQDGRFELVMPRGSEVIIKGAATATKGQVCPSLSEFQAELKQVSGGLFDQRASSLIHETRGPSADPLSFGSRLVQRLPRWR